MMSGTPHSPERHSGWEYGWHPAEIALAVIFIAVLLAIVAALIAEAVA